ncbi:MAG: hypothetical protein L6V93_17820 [Clostridiales bacterium]|nr:MAG: hypothetical protein L6V93_17820 [Clostridiales bacterium]
MNIFSARRSEIKCTRQALQNTVLSLRQRKQKPQSERNGFPGINATTDVGMRLADKIGYSAVRYHYIRWGDSQLEKGTHTAKGQFDWTQTDQMAESMSKKTI